LGYLPTRCQADSTKANKFVTEHDLQSFRIGQFAALLLLQRKLPPRVAIRLLVAEFPDEPVHRVAFEFLEIVVAYSRNFKSANGPEADLVAEGYEALAVLHADVHLLEAQSQCAPLCRELSKNWGEQETYFTEPKSKLDVDAQLS
jgi:hypothetical protein